MYFTSSLMLLVKNIKKNMSTQDRNIFVIPFQVLFNLSIANNIFKDTNKNDNNE